VNCGQKIYVKYLKMSISLSTMESKTLPLNLDFTNLLNKKMLLAINHHYIIKLFNETWSYVTFLPLTVKEATPTIQEAESVRHRSPTSASVCKSISVHRCLKNMRNVSWASNQYIRMISEGSCDTEYWSNDAENSALITGINYILQYIHIENSYFKL